MFQLKTKQLLPGIFKFSTYHGYYPFNLKCFMPPHTFLSIFHAGSRRLGSKNPRNLSCKNSLLTIS